MSIMEYTEYLINKENINLGEFDIYSKVIKMICNQQEIKNITKKMMNTLKDLQGEVSLVTYDNGRFNLMNFLGDKNKIDMYLSDKVLLNEVKESKKPYFAEPDTNKHHDYHTVLPIVVKDEFLGALIIHDEQKIENWKEIYIFLHLIALTFKTYNLIDVTKNINTQDVVTGLFNHRHFQNQLDLEIEKHTRHYIPVTLIMVDIENFKIINEKLGYDTGDIVLKEVAKWIKSQCRRIDMPVRLEADTFAVLLSNTNLDGAKALLNRIVFQFNKKSIEINDQSFKIKAKTSVIPYEQHFTKDGFIEKAKKNLK